MRIPTPLDVQLAWWRDALDGMGKIVASALNPQPGFYKRKMVSGGIHVPARIWLEQDIHPETGELLCDEMIRCEIDGKERNAFDAWPWLWSNPISEAEYNYMRAQAEWAREHAPSDPAANPRQRLSALTTPVRF